MIFEEDEYRSRVAATRTRMEAGAIEVLVIADPANMAYLTGYDAWSFYVPQCLVVSLYEEEPIWIGRMMDRAAAVFTTWLSDINVLGYPDIYVQSTERHAFDFVADEIRSRGWDRAVIAVEMDAHYYSAACHAALLKGLPNAQIRDSRQLVNWVRVIKSDAEIAVMKQAAAITNQVMRRAFEMVEPGRRQCDAVAEIYDAMIRGNGDCGGDYPAIVPLLPTGAGTATPHLTWTDEPFKMGEATILELVGVRHRYHVPMARTVHLGPPPETLVKTARIVMDGTEAALEAAKPGNTAGDVHEAWRAYTEAHGLFKESRIGYSIGLNYPPDWGERTLSVRAGDDTILHPNMTLHIIPGIWMFDWGVEISHAIRITETGHERFCDVPEDLLVKT